MDVNNASYSPEEMQVMNEKWGKGYLQFFSLDELLEKFDTEEVLERFEPEERLKGLDSEIVFNQFTPEQIEAYLKKIKR